MAPTAVEEHPVMANGNRTSAPESDQQETGLTIRWLARSGQYTTPTASAAPGHLQANLIVLPSRYASDFRSLCQRNPVPCPLLADSRDVGNWSQLRSHLPGLTGEQIAHDLDIRNDFPRYMIYDNGVLSKSHTQSIESEWTEDHVAFLIGCSFSFDSALVAAGLPPAHVTWKRNVPMYRTTVPLCPAGAFKSSTYIVSMRPYPKKDIERVRDITRPYVITHGEPLDWGWDAVKRLGIADIDSPEYGDPPVTLDGLLGLVEGLGQADEELVPVFFGCGVTPQEAVQRAELEGRVFAHAPGHMITLDLVNSDIIRKV